MIRLETKAIAYRKTPHGSFRSGQNVVSRIPHIKHFPGIIKSLRQHLGCIIVLRKKKVPVTRLSLHQLTIRKRQVGLWYVVTDSLQRRTVPRLQINLPRALAKEEWEVIVVHQIT